MISRERIHDAQETRERKRHALMLAKVWLFVLGATLGVAVGIGITLWR